MNSEDIEGYVAARRFSKELGEEIVGRIEVGMTERDVEKLAGEVLRAHNVNQHWHMPIIGVGKGTSKLRNSFALGTGLITRYFRKVKENDIVLIDIAPIHNGYPGDYTTMHVIGKNPEFEEFVSYAREVAYEIAKKITYDMIIRDAFNMAEGFIKSKKRYKLAFPPLIFLGHRLVRIPPNWQKLPESGLMYLLLGKGGSFLKPGNSNLIDGLWVIEPYLLHDKYGAKFEVLLLVEVKTVILA